MRLKRQDWIFGLFVLITLIISGCDNIPIEDQKAINQVNEIRSDIESEVQRLSYGNTTGTCADFNETCQVDIDCCKGYWCSESICTTPPSFCSGHKLSTVLGIFGLVILFLSMAGQSFIGIGISQLFARIGYGKIPFLVVISVGFLALITSVILSGFC